VLESSFSENKKNINGSISFHLARVHHAVPNLDWNRIHDLIRKVLVNRGIKVYIYTKDRNDNDKIKTSNEKKTRAKKDEQVEKETKKEEKKEIDDDTDDDLTPSSPMLNDSLKDDVLENCRIVISGYSPDETNEITKKIESMSGTVQSKWVIFGANKSTHMVCESFTDAFEHAYNLGATIVTRQWIDECQKVGKKVSVTDYVYPRKSKSKVAKKRWKLRENC